MDKSASLGKGMEKSAKPDKPHHSDKLNRKKKAFEKKANSKTADISFCTDKQTYTDFAIAFKGIPDNLREARKKSDICQYCGKPGHRWTVC
jgi:hypothetical protein